MTHLFFLGRRFLCAVVVRNVSGKINRKALPAPDQTDRHSSAPKVAPRTPTEELLAGIWCELLGVEQVSRHDDFFALGGHSLLAIQAIARLREQFGVELPMQSLLFEAPTIAGIAQLVKEQRATKNEVLDEQESGEDMAALLAEIKALSADEVAAELGEA